MSRRRGLFITFEGGEGAGKSTQLRRLAARIEAGGRTVVVTREPGGAPGAEEIRRLVVTGTPDRWDALTEALLITAARRVHVEQTVRPALAAGSVVISDRFADSTLAYQGCGHGVPRSTLDRLRRIAIGRLKPDLTLILDVPVETGLARAAARHGDETRFEGMERAFHERLRAGFLAIAAAEPGRCRVIDAAADVDQVESSIRTAVRDRLGLDA